MLARKFNSIMCPINTIWAARALNMQPNYRPGPDLIDEKKHIELKFNLTHSFNYSHQSWRVLEHQMKYNQNGKPVFWGLAFYTLNQEISEMRANTSLSLEKYVSKRELYIVEWDWMYQFPAYHHKGKTNKSEWDHWIRFPKAKLLPRTVLTYPVKKGLIHITEKIPIDIFNIKENRL